MGAVALIRSGFERLFVDGPVGSSTGGGEQQVITVEQVGELALPTGRLVAADPFVVWPEDAEPFTDEVEPGNYPVSVSLVSYVDGDGVPDERQGYRVAAARVVIRDEPAYSWRPAVTAGEHVPMLPVMPEFGYDVKSSTGAFFDVVTATALDRLVSDDELGNCDLIDALGAVGGGRGPANVTDARSGLNVVAFSTGWGDGVYPTWVGRNTAGDPVAFVTDFFVVNKV
ncbi:DUF4241 domain-containing protein [Lentzea sp. NBRC 102530]|uniref:DUF4241 domain-containing protein n=1 Tax=Lentzea sp. NBRC 102530 TaxID=3032201 RepID=UPI0024A1382B|nr:DUF4241 domain-containing protein [Lentzea sp. NBRC 102530]GLY48605.1 hypothetical protein Lesp01_22610 [Lentzea sp. NBRC 102530]